MSLSTQDQLAQDIEKELSEIYIEIIVILMHHPEWSGLVYDTITTDIRYWIDDLKSGQYPTDTDLISLDLNNLSIN